MILVHILNGTQIDQVSQHKDLGILFDDSLKFHDHASTVSGKANRLLGLISKSFEFLEPEMFVKIYKTLVRPILEYCNPIWGPNYILDQRIENVQRRATCLIPSIRNNTYPERLAILDLPFIQIRGDLIFMYKIINNYFSTDFSRFFSFSTTSNRGHNFKLFKQHTRLQIRSNYFFNRIINKWNSLSSIVVNARSINSFKLLLDNNLIDSKFIFV